jgi:hypothetical protein
LDRTAGPPGRLASEGRRRLEFDEDDAAFASLSLFDVEVVEVGARVIYAGAVDTCHFQHLALRVAHTEGPGLLVGGESAPRDALVWLADDDVPSRKV